MPRHLRNMAGLDQGRELQCWIVCEELVSDREQAREDRGDLRPVR